MKSAAHKGKNAGKNGRVLVFGVFDVLHAGHRFFLRRARAFGAELIAVVARDSSVRDLKGRLPHRKERVRLAAVQRTKEVARAVLGDAAQSAYTVLKRLKPDIICLGYDQHALERDLEKRIRRGTIPCSRLVRIGAYHPDKYHSSIRPVA